MKRQRSLSEICSNTEVVELWPPRRQSLRAPGYGQHCVLLKPSRQALQSHHPRRLRGCPRAMPSPCCSSFQCVLHGNGHRTNRRLPFAATHKHPLCEKKRWRRKGQQERLRGNKRAALPSQARGRGSAVCATCSFANLLGRNKRL